MGRAETHILSTAELSEVHVHRALSRGLRIRVLPFIRTEKLFNGVLQETIGQHARTEAHVLFTSVHAVEATRNLLQTDHVPTWTVHCVGERTREAAQARIAGLREGHTASYAEELARSLIANGSIREVLFFCGDQRLDTLPTLLRGAGIAVGEVVVYRTIATPQRIAEVPDGILFLSPTAVASYFSMNALHASSVPFAIGRTTADALAQHTAQCIILPAHPGRSALIDTVCAHFTTASA